MARKTAKEIVQEQMPDMDVVEPPPAVASDAVKGEVKPGPSMADLRRKYLGADADKDGEPELASDPDDGDVEVKQVRPKTTPADPADDPGPRTVIVSRKKGILGSQG